MSEGNSTVEYRLIEGYERYRVGNDGSVWSSCVSKEWRQLKVYPNRLGYLHVCLTDLGGRAVCKSVHRLVLTAFVGSCPPGMECCHNNGIRADNRLANLRWDTKSNNYADRIAHGSGPLNRGGPKACYLGEAAYNAKLTDSVVKEIRRRYASGEMSKTKLAKVYGVSPAAVCAVIARRTWKHVA